MNKPNLLEDKPTINADENVWGIKLNKIIDKLQTFVNSIVDTVSGKLDKGNVSSNYNTAEKIENQIKNKINQEDFDRNISKIEDKQREVDNFILTFQNKNYVYNDHKELYDNQGKITDLSINNLTVNSINGNSASGGLSEEQVKAICSKYYEPKFDKKSGWNLDISSDTNSNSDNVIASTKLVYNIAQKSINKDYLSRIPQQLSIDGHILKYKVEQGGRFIDKELNLPKSVTEEWANNKFESKIEEKKTGFNKDKSDDYTLDDSNVLSTTKATNNIAKDLDKVVKDINIDGNKLKYKEGLIGLNKELELPSGTGGSAVLPPNTVLNENNGDLTTKSGVPIKNINITSINGKSLEESKKNRNLSFDYSEKKEGIPPKKTDFKYAYFLDTYTNKIIFIEDLLSSGNFDDKNLEHLVCNFNYNNTLKRYLYLDYDSVDVTSISENTKMYDILESWELENERLYMSTWHYSIDSKQYPAYYLVYRNNGIVHSYGVNNIILYPNIQYNPHIYPENVPVLFMKLENMYYALDLCSPILLHEKIIEKNKNNLSDKTYKFFWYVKEFIKTHLGSQDVRQLIDYKPIGSSDSYYNKKDLNLTPKLKFEDNINMLTIYGNSSWGNVTYFNNKHINYFYKIDLSSDNSYMLYGFVSLNNLRSYITTENTIAQPFAIYLGDNIFYNRKIKDIWSRGFYMNSKYYLPNYNTYIFDKAYTYKEVIQNNILSTTIPSLDNKVIIEEKVVSDSDVNTRAWMSALNCSNQNQITLSSNTYIKSNNLSISFLFFLLRAKLNNSNQYKIAELCNSLSPFDIIITHNNIDYRFFVIPNIPYVNAYSLENNRVKYWVGLKINNSIYIFKQENFIEFSYNIPTLFNINELFRDIISIDYDFNANFEDYWSSYQRNTLFSWTKELYNKYSFKCVGGIRDKNNIKNYIEWSNGSLRNYLQSKSNTVSITNVRLKVNETMLNLEYLEQYKQTDEYWLKQINKVLNTNRNITLDAEGN